MSSSSSGSSQGPSKAVGEQIKVEKYDAARRLRFRVWTNWGHEHHCRIACSDDPTKPEIVPQPVALIRPVSLPQRDFAGAEIEQLLRAKAFFELGERLVRELMGWPGLVLQLDTAEPHQIDFRLEGSKPEHIETVVENDINRILKAAAVGTCSTFSIHLMKWKKRS